jgi:UPF0716 family protein affecting phage T7 exclusion
VGIFFLPVLKGRLGLATTVAIAAAVSLAGLIITWMLGVETAGKSLEEVQHATAPAHRSGLG